MKNIYFILSQNGEFTKKAGTIEIKFQNPQNEQNTPNTITIPIKQTYGIAIMNTFSLTSQLASLIKQEQIPIAFTHSDGTPIGTFRPFGRPTAKTLLQFYKMTHYEPEKNIELIKTIVKNNIEHKIAAISLYKNPEIQNLKTQSTQIIESITNTTTEPAIIKTMEEFNSTFIETISSTIGNIPNTISTFLSGLTYSILEFAIFHTQLDPRYGVFRIRPQIKTLPLVDDLMRFYEGIFQYHIYYKYIRDTIEPSRDHEHTLSDKTKRIITAKYLQFIERTIQLKSLNRHTRILEIPKIQLYRWIKYANGLSELPTAISLKSIVR